MNNPTHRICSSSWHYFAPPLFCTFTVLKLHHHYSSLYFICYIFPFLITFGLTWLEEKATHSFIVHVYSDNKGIFYSILFNTVHQTVNRTLTPCIQQTWRDINIQLKSYLCPLKVIIFRISVLHCVHKLVVCWLVLQWWTVRSLCCILKRCWWQWRDGMNGKVEEHETKSVRWKMQNTLSRADGNSILCWFITMSHFHISHSVWPVVYNILFSAILTQL